MDVSVLLGKILKSVCIIGDNEALLFETEDGVRYHMHHAQDGGEYVYLESVVGDLEDLVGSTILLAEEVSNLDEPDMSDISQSVYCEWTFYKFATRKGYVDLRWLGTSNGHYSVGVDFEVM